MKTRSLAVVLTILAVTSMSGAQTPAPGAATDPRPVAVPVPAAVASRGAPWLRFDESKRQYYVFKSYAPPDVAAQLDRPVADPAYRALLTARARAFRSGPRTLSLTINPDSIIDVGSVRPEDANTMAAINLEKSPELLEIVRNELKVDPQTNYVMPFLSSMYTRSDAPQAYVAYDEIIVSVVPTDLSQVSVWRLSDGRWQRAHQASAGTAPSPERQKVLKQQLQSSLGPLSFERYLNLAKTPTISSVTMEKFQALKKKQAEEDKQAEVPPPATSDSTYTAYGRAGTCHHYCSTSSCSGCCLQVRGVAMGHITALAIGCHIASDFCPWCHFGCAANTGMLMAITTTQYSGCVSSCSAPYEAVNSQGNPRRCPVH